MPVTEMDRTAAGDVVEVADRVGVAADAVGDAADAIGQAAPILSGATDRIGDMAGSVSAVGGAIGGAADGIDKALDDVPTLSPEERRVRIAALGPQLAELQAARAEMFDRVERLEASGYAALDVPTSIRRHPARIAGLAAGTGFIALDGPGRAWRMLRGRLVPSRVSTPLPPGLTRALGGDDEAVNDLATLLAAGRVPRKKSRLAGLLSGTIFLPLGLRWGRDLAGTLLETDPTTFDRRLKAVKERNAARNAGPGGSASGASPASGTGPAATPPAPSSSTSGTPPATPRG
jgi:hypothetical protein